MTYEQSQLEMFSLRNDRLCSYSISVQYWHEAKQIYLTTGQKNHVFGIAKSQHSPLFEVELPYTDFEEDNETNKKELFIMFSFVFPVD